MRLCHEAIYPCLALFEARLQVLDIERPLAAGAV